MIKLHRLNKSEYYLNSDEIHQIEAFPDTTLTLKNGERYVVRESVEEVYQKILKFKASIVFGALREIMGQSFFDYKRDDDINISEKDININEKNM